MLSRTILSIFLLATCGAWGAEQAPKLSTFPKVNRVWLGLEDGSIQPKNYESFKTDVTRFIVVHAADGQTLKKDQHWLTIEPEELDLERKALLIEEDKFKLKLKDERWSSADILEKKKLSLDELKSKKEELIDFLEQKKNIGGLHKRVQQGLLDIEKKIVRVQTQIDPENVKKELDLIEAEGLLDLKRKRKRLDLLERRSIVKAPFGGELKLSELVNQKIAKLKSANEPIWIDSNTTIGTLVDEKHYEVVVKLTNAYARKAAPATLMVLLQDSQTGSLIQGDFDRVEEIETNAGIKHNCVFKLNNLDVNVAKHSSGEIHFVHVYRKFPKAHHLVHKKDIAFIAPTILKKRGWSGLVRHLWPKSKVLQVGPQTILIKSSDEN